MRILLDEQLWPDLAPALNAFERRNQLIFVHIDSIAAGAKDPQIPDICRKHSVSALVSANVRDFGARRIIFEALLDAGISVVVLRPSKRVILTPEVQGAMLFRHLPRIASALRGAQQRILLKLTEGGIVETSLEQLHKEIG